VNTTKALVSDIISPIEKNTIYAEFDMFFQKINAGGWPRRNDSSIFARL